MMESSLDGVGYYTTITTPILTWISVSTNNTCFATGVYIFW